MDMGVSVLINAIYINCGMLLQFSKINLHNLYQCFLYPSVYRHTALPGRIETEPHYEAKLLAITSRITFLSTERVINLTFGI